MAVRALAGLWSYLEAQWRMGSLGRSLRLSVESVSLFSTPGGYSGVLALWINSTATH